MKMEAMFLDKIKSWRLPSQSPGEWSAYLEFIETYFRNRNIENPLIVEIGIGFGQQKRFYVDFLEYQHIGIDRLPKRRPDILGDSKDSATLKALKKKLAGREVNLLYLDGAHNYETLSSDYEMYAPLAKNIIVIHDIVIEVHQKSAGRFWKELIASHLTTQDRTFITMTGYCIQHGKTKTEIGQGTGLILIQ